MHISSPESARRWRRWATISLLSLSAFGSSALGQDTIFGSLTPGTPDGGPDSSVNLGVRFQSSVAGTISGIRFYKSSSNTGTHIGTLYTDSGTQLAQATFSGETSSGWQQVTFTPVSISANTTYVAAYLSPVGHYAADNNYFTSAHVNSPLTALADNPSGDRNSVYTYGSSPAFPTSTYQACNYWVDVLFNPSGSVPGVPSNLQGNAVSSSQINLTWTASTGTVTGYHVYRNSALVGSPTTTSYSDTGLTASTQYSYYINAYNGNGNSANTSTIQVTTQAAGGTNVAPNGTAYDWHSNTTATSNANQVAMPGLNDGNTTTDNDLAGAQGWQDNTQNAYEAGGVIWSTAQSISSVAFVNGSWNGSDGSYCANMTMQTTTDGSTWTESGWSFSPSYTYNASDAGTTFTFSGTAVSVLGVRVSGEVHCGTNRPFFENMTEVMAYTSGGGGNPPGAPSSLQGNAVSSSQINLTWTASTGTVTAYQVYRNGAKIASPTSTSYSDTGLTASTQYSYYVNAYNSYGTSGNSNTIQVTTQSNSGVPGAPSGLQGLASSATQNDLVWAASTGTVTGYYVYRNGTNVGTAAYTAYTDTGLTANTQYSYYVVGYNSNGNSGNSNTVNVTTLTSASGGLPTLLRTFFPLGPDGQPTSNLSTWASRGANTLIRIGGGENFTSWNSTANALGLKYIRGPASPASADVGNTNLLSWHQDDEPCSGDTSASLQSLFAQWKATDITRPVSVNLAPGGMLGLGGCTAAQNQPYIDNTSDWAMNDIYPVAGWDAPNNVIYPNNWVGEALQQMAAISRGRPQMQFVECAEQNLSWCPQCPAPTPGQFHTEFWDAIINGARGIFLFPEAISPFYWDNTTPAMQTQIEADWATVQALTSALQTTVNPSGMSATVTAPLEAGWRNSGHQYFIVDNTDSNAHNSQTITLTGTGSATSAVVYGESRNVNIVSGAITDNFAANAVHIYQVN